MGLWIKEHKMAAAGLGLLIILSVMALLGPLCSPYGYSQQDTGSLNLPASLAHLFGTDKFGRDIFVRIWYGTRISLLIGFGSVLINGVIGTLYGGAAGYIGGKIDFVMMRLADVITSIPSLLYIILITLVCGADVGSILLGTCVAGWVSTARIARGEVLEHKNAEFIMASKLSGANHRYIFWKHLLPAAVGPVIVSLTALFPQAIFAEAFLSFVGVGIAAPRASLGTLIQEARSQLLLHPVQMVFPVVVLCLLVISVHLIGADLEERGGKIKRYDR